MRDREREWSWSLSRSVAPGPRRASGGSCSPTKDPSIRPLTPRSEQLDEHRGPKDSWRPRRVPGVAELGCSSRWGLRPARESRTPNRHPPEFHREVLDSIEFNPDGVRLMADVIGKAPALTRHASEGCSPSDRSPASLHRLQLRTRSTRPSEHTFVSIASVHAIVEARQ